VVEASRHTDHSAVVPVPAFAASCLGNAACAVRRAWDHSVAFRCGPCLEVYGSYLEPVGAVMVVLGVVAVVGTLVEAAVPSCGTSSAAAVYFEPTPYVEEHIGASFARACYTGVGVAVRDQAAVAYDLYVVGTAGHQLTLGECLQLLGWAFPQRSSALQYQGLVMVW